MLYFLGKICFNELLKSLHLTFVRLTNSVQYQFIMIDFISSHGCSDRIKQTKITFYGLILFSLQSLSVNLPNLFKYCIPNLN